MGPGLLTLFEMVVALPAGERSGFLDRVCAGQPALRAEIEAMLASDATRQGVDLDLPALGRASDLLAAARASAEQIPECIAGFRILGRLGEGGGGIVFRAQQERPRREVALKLLHLVGASRDGVRRFANEVEALARLRHPGITHIYQAGVATVWGAELPFLAMELVEGVPLRVWRQVAGPDRDSCLAVVLQLLDTIQYAHQQGVIHRDLKPENIVVETAGGAPRARILDFGVARVRAESMELRETTAHGAIVGTLAYMSPEQAAGDADVDTRSDVYSIGAVCYELLSGRVPNLVGADTAESLARIRNVEAVPLGRLDPKCGGDLELVVGKALRKDRADRYRSAGAFADDLRRVLAHEPVRARPATAWYQLRMFARRRRALVAALGVLALASLVAVAGLVMSAMSAERSRQLAVSVLTMVSRRVFELEQSLGTVNLRRQLLSGIGTELRTLLDREPEVPEYLALQADLLDALGNIEVQQDRAIEARPLREQALAIRERLVCQRPGDMEQRSRLATDIVRLGDLSRSPDGIAAAVPHYSRAHAIFEEIVARQPHDVRALDDLANSCHRLAHAAIEAGDCTRAGSLLAREDELAARLDTVAPERVGNLAVHRDLATMRAHLEIARGDEAAACGHLEASLAFSRAWLDRRPDDKEAWVGYLGVVESLAGRLWSVGRRGEARDLVATSSQRISAEAAQADDERVASILARLRTWSATHR